jgi:DNA-binding LacI/PurR family transcriptional regulator
LDKLAAKALFNEIKTKKKENINVVVESKIIIRKSTRALQYLLIYC